MNQKIDLEKIISNARLFSTDPENQVNPLSRNDMSTLIRDPKTTNIEEGKIGEGFFITAVNHDLKFIHAHKEAWWRKEIKITTK